MLAALASAALIVAGSLAVGQALLTICGRREWTWLAGPVGLALLLTLASLLATVADARGPAIAVVAGALIVASSVYLAVDRRRRGGGLTEHPQHGREDGAEHGRGAAPEGLRRAGAPLTAAALAALFAALPFIAAGNVGILGVGLVNDDMASHLLIADWIDERFRPEPVFIDQGYPLGPHALVAGLSTLLAASSVDVFAGLTLAIPALTALVVFAALSGLRPVPRALCAVVASLPYMAAAYLAQEAFKEPLLVLFLLTFALLLPTARSPREAIPLGVLAAGVVYVYSFPGLAWLLGTALIWVGIELVRRRAGGRLESIRSTDARTVRSRDAKLLSSATLRLGAPALGAVLAIFAVLIAPEIGRLLDFVDYRALDPDRANDGGLGNLREQLSALTAFGVWPTSEFRLSAGAGSLPAVAFYAGALAGAVALVLALPRWMRRHGAAIPAALLTAAGLYLAARAFGTVYTSAKAIAIAAPLVTLVILGGLLAGGAGRALRALAVAVAVATAFSSFLILRQAPVGPEDHMEELAEIRPLVEGEKLLFLGRDNFVLWELRGSRPFVAVRNYYVPDSLYVRPNTELEDVFAKFDFDSVTAATLAEFPYVLTTRAAYASSPPPSYELAASTRSYDLWERGGDAGRRQPAETGAEPGRLNGCPRGELEASASFAAPPVLASPWDRSTIEDGEQAAARLRLPAGTWDVSLQYDATRPVTLQAPGYTATLPGNLDYRGPAPYWAAGSIELARETEVTITAEVEDPPLAGRVLGSDSVAHLGALAATARRGSRTVTSGCGGYVDWYAPRR